MEASGVILTHFRDKKYAMGGLSRAVTRGILGGSYQGQGRWMGDDKRYNEYNGDYGSDNGNILGGQRGIRRGNGGNRGRHGGNGGWHGGQ